MKLYIYFIRSIIEGIREKCSAFFFGRQIGGFGRTIQVDETRISIQKIKRTIKGQTVVIGAIEIQSRA